MLRRLHSLSRTRKNDKGGDDDSGDDSSLSVVMDSTMNKSMFGDDDELICQRMRKGIRIATNSRDQQSDRLWINLEANEEDEKHTVVSPRKLAKIKEKHIFKSYAGNVFSRLRQLFKIDQEEFLQEVASGKPWTTFSTNSKSGSLFYVTSGGNFLIKTMSHGELKYVLSSVVGRYYEHVDEHPDTFLVKILGMYRVDRGGIGGRRYFYVMKSVFDGDVEVQKKYDLKGSTIGRSQSVDLDRSSEENVCKDIEFRMKGIDIVIQDREHVAERLVHDVRFLQSVNVMDYSLLLGIHDRLGEDGLRPMFSLEGLGSGIVGSEENHRYIYWMGIIDIFQQYNTKKKIEYQVKGKIHDKQSISAVPAEKYANRFLKAILPHIKGA